MPFACSWTTSTQDIQDEVDKGSRDQYRVRSLHLDRDVINYPTPPLDYCTVSWKGNKRRIIPCLKPSWWVVLVILNVFQALFHSLAFIRPWMLWFVWDPIKNSLLTIAPSSPLKEGSLWVEAWNYGGDISSPSVLLRTECIWTLISLRG